MSEQELSSEIEALERKLKTLKGAQNHSLPINATEAEGSLHNLLLLSDSALPLGSFAFSAGLESFLAHVSRKSSSPNVNIFRNFLRLSTESLAGMTLPYVQRAWSHPDCLECLDNDFDASTTCTVARRASVAQGRALLTMWQRSLQMHLSSATPHQQLAHHALKRFSDLTTAAAAYDGTSPCSLDPWTKDASAHFAPLFGALAAMMGLPLHQTLYLYLLSHVKMVLGSAIRASVLGPYQSQGLLASEWLKAQVERLVRNQMISQTGPKDAGQAVPILDIWSGRHELVYSRIFNS